MNQKYSILFLVLLIIGVSWTFFGKELRGGYQEGIAARRVTYLCLALDKGNVSNEKLCSAPITEIAVFRQYYEKLAIQDAAWFEQRGWKYYPEVVCEENQTTFSIMDKSFRCAGPKAELLEGVRSQEQQTKFAFVETAYAQAASCYEKSGGAERKIISDVLRDGTIVLDGGMKVVLLGVKLPKNDEGKEEPCAKQAFEYIKARVINQSASIYYENKFDRDDQGRGSVYIVTSQGAFLNRDLLRYGLARAVLRNERTGHKLLCATELTQMERVARNKEFGLWGDGC